MKPKKTIIYFMPILLCSCMFISCANKTPYKNNSSPQKSQQVKKTTPTTVYIDDIKINDKSKDEVLKSLKDKYNTTLENKKITVSTPNKNYILTYKDVKASYNIDKVVNDAYSFLEKPDSKYKDKEKKFNLTLCCNEDMIDNFIKKIHNETYKKSTNASITLTNSSSFKITPENIGENLNKDKLKKDIISSLNNLYKKNNITIKAPLEKSQPKITKSQLETINTNIASYSTELSGSKERINNIALGAKSINGIVLMSGENFSFNDTIGKVSKNTGYKEAPAIVENEMHPSVGGGLCQVATTLYNAVLRANIPYVERTKHSMPPKYVKPGLDATISSNKVDYKFKNTLNFPIYIQSSINNGKLTFNIYSNSQLAKYKYDYIPDVYSTIPNQTKHINDPSLPKGKEVIDKPGSKGYKVKVFKVTYENGKQVSKKLYYEDFYKPTDKVIKVNK